MQCAGGGEDSCARISDEHSSSDHPNASDTDQGTPNSPRDPIAKSTPEAKREDDECQADDQKVADLNPTELSDASLADELRDRVVAGFGKAEDEKDNYEEGRRYHAGQRESPGHLIARSRSSRALVTQVTGSLRELPVRRDVSGGA